MRHYRGKRAYFGLLIAFALAAASHASAASCTVGDALSRARSAHGKIENKEAIAVLDDLPFDPAHAPPGSRKPLPAFDPKDPKSSLDRIARAATGDGRVTGGRFTHPVVERNYFAGRDWTKIELLNSQGARVGTIEYTLSGGTLKIEMMHLESSARGLDLSTSLVAEALAKNPGVARVEADFAMTNLEAFHGGGAENTPFYKSFSRLGFGKIASGSGPNPMGYHIVLERSY